MKSVLQAGWLLTVAVGNIIVLIVAGAGQFSEQVWVGKETACTALLSISGHHDDPPEPSTCVWSTHLVTE